MAVNKIQATNSWHAGYRVWLTEEQALENAQLVANHLGDTWSPTAISALCGNMRAESSLNPDMYEFGYEWEEDRGYGLVQWTPRSKYWDWAVARALQPREGDSQLSRIDYEVDNDIQWIANGHAKRYGLEDKYDFSFEYFRNNDEVGLWDMVEAFMWNYEGPRYDAGQASLPSRIQFAELVATTIDFDNPVIPDEPDKLPYYITNRHSTNMRRMGVRGRR